MSQNVSLDAIRRSAVARSLFAPTTLPRAIDALGFVQADPIRAPARAQDLTLRHRVGGYRAGDLERRYASIGIEEDVFINYGFVPRAVQALMHPRMPSSRPAAAKNKRERALLDFVRERREVHPRDVDAYFSHGTVTNYWGGSSNATTHLLDALHYRGLLRVARRDGGIRVYALQQHVAEPLDAAARRARIDALIDIVVHKYAPLPASSLSFAVRRLRYAAPQWRHELTAGIQRAKRRLSHARVDGHDWYWPAGETLATDAAADTVRLLAPFDPVVWDRDRFELLWGWAYRFEAYTPLAKRVRGYYALPLLWRDRVIGWGNLAYQKGALTTDIGYIGKAPNRDRGFRRELEAELERIRLFLSPTEGSPVTKSGRSVSSSCP
jgi:uncharacterized protein